MILLTNIESIVNAAARRLDIRLDEPALEVLKGSVTAVVASRKIDPDVVIDSIDKHRFDVPLAENMKSGHSVFRAQESTLWIGKYEFLIKEFRKMLLNARLLVGNEMSVLKDMTMVYIFIGCAIRMACEATADQAMKN